MITFLTLPMVIFLIQLYNWTHPGFLIAEAERVDRLREFIGEYMRNITILVFGLAGLRTWENIKNGTAKTEKPPLKQDHELSPK